MGHFQIDMDLYFWLIDRANIPDDKKNQVLVDDNQVILHRDLSQRLFNGIHIATLLQNIRKIVIKKSKKSFTLDPQLYNLKDQSIPASKVSNWTILQTELKKFGVKLNTEIIEQIHEGNEETMEGIVQQLFKYDQTVNAYPDVVGPTGTIMNQKKPTSDVSLDAKIPDHANGKETVPYHKHSTSAAHNRKISKNVNDMEKDLDMVMGKSKSKKNLRDRQGTAAHDDFDQFDAEMDTGIDKRGDQSGIGSIDRLSFIENLPDFIYETLSISLKMTPNQAAALLTSNQKFLIHMCVKGMKGNDYSKLKAWYKLLMSKTKEFIDLLIRQLNDPRAIKQALNVLKCGMFSHNSIVAEHTISLFLKIHSECEERPEKVSKILLKELYEWFVITQGDIKDTSFKNVTGDVKESWIKIPKNPKSLEKLITQPGMTSMLRCWFYHQDVMLEKVAQLMICFGEAHALDVFTVHLRRHVQNNKDYLVFVHDHLIQFNSTAIGKKILVESFPMVRILTFALELSTNDGGSLVERQASLGFLVHTWRVRPDIIEKNKALIDGIVDALKAGCRDLKSQTLRTSSYYLLFSLLYDFGKEKSKFAPTIYHILTYMLIECYSFLEQREDLLKNFILVFQLNPHIPINILCDPLLKQIQIFLEKDNNRLLEENKTASILMPDSELFNLNVTDFELFMAIATHKKCSVNLAVNLMEIACEVGRKHIMFTRASLKLVLTLLARFESYIEMFVCMQNIVKRNLNVIYSQDLDKVSLYVRLKDQLPAIMRKETDADATKGAVARKAAINRSQMKGIQVPPQSNKIVQAEPIINLGVDGRIDDTIIKTVFNAKYFPEETNTYTNFKQYERMIVNLLQCVIHSGHARIQENIKEQLLNTFLRIEHKTKFRNRAIYYLMSLYGKDVETLLKQKKNRVAKDRLGKMQEQRAENASNMSRQKTTRFETQSYDGVGSLSRSPTKRSPQKRAETMVDLVQSSSKTERHTKNKKIRVSSQYYDLTGLPMKIGDVIYSEKDLQMPVRIKKPKSPKGAKVERTRLYDIMLQPQQIQYDYTEYVKRRIKLYKALYINYAQKSDIRFKPKAATFDNFNDLIMNMQEIYRFLSDYKIAKTEFNNRNEITYLIKQINFKFNGGVGNVQSLDFEGFIELILQLGHKLYKVITHDPQVFLEFLFDRLRVAGVQFNPPLFQKNFDGIEYPQHNIDPAKMRQIAMHANINPHFQVPHMLSKYPVPIKENPGLQVAQGVIQDILMENFGFEIYQARLANKTYRVRYNDREINKTPVKNYNNERLSYITSMPQNNIIKYKPKSGGSPDKMSVGRSNIDTDITSQKTLQPRQSYKYSSPSVRLASDIKSVKKSISKVPDDYNFQFERPHIGGLTRNSHGAKILEDVGKRNANRISQTLDSGNIGPGKYGEQQNKIQFLRAEAAEIKKMKQQRKEELYQERADELKYEMDQIKNQRQRERQLKAEKIQLRQDRKAQREADNQAEKEQYYAQIKQEYESERLPDIDAKKQAAYEKRRTRRELKMENALKVESTNVENLHTLFEQMEKQNKKKANASKVKEQRLKRDMSKHRVGLNPQSSVKSIMEQNVGYGRDRSKSVKKLPGRLDGMKTLGGQNTVQGTHNKALNIPSPRKKSNDIQLSKKIREISMENDSAPVITKSSRKQPEKKKGFFGF